MKARIAAPVRVALPRSEEAWPVRTCSARKPGEHRHRLFQAQTEQPGAGEQHEGERDLGHDEAVAQALGGAAGRCWCASRSWSGSRRPARAGYTRRPARPSRHPSATAPASAIDASACVEDDLGAEGKVLGAQSCASRRIPAAPTSEAEQTAGQRQHQGFDQHFGHDAAVESRRVPAAPLAPFDVRWRE